MAASRRHLGEAWMKWKSNVSAGIEILATDPARQREGAATILVKWATDKFDAKGCRAMLEASKVATQYRMYEKHGF